MLKATMKRLYEPHAYCQAPRAQCYWASTLPPADWPSLHGTETADVAIIGAGFTGLNAALVLAQAGKRVIVLDAEAPGWGASGRNGGFCCLGGGIIEDAHIEKVNGKGTAAAWHRMEADAVAHVARILDIHGIDADTFGTGETLLAHKPNKWRAVQHHAESAAANNAVHPTVIPADKLPDHGMSKTFHGGAHTPIGFGLNPAKYTAGLAEAAQHAGAAIYARSPVTRIEQTGGYTLHSPNGTVTAPQILVATNGYSSDDLPAFLKGKYLPVQSSVLVTRPLSAQECADAEWTTDTMAYDSRNLLHYFRMLPDGRFLFGTRGGIFASPRNDMKTMRKARRDFEAMFPAWEHVETPFEWSGLVCIGAKGMPFAGAIPDMPGAFASLSYHGNGVAMGSYCGAQIAKVMLGDADALHPMIQRAPPNLPLGSWRRWLLIPAYAMMSLKDRF
ncbi:MAG: FAD-dependent oxidoreductase [Pseudomonadota bacterium]